MMPNKRNPDPAELVRGRTSRVIGALTGSLVLLKGLPAGYQRDLQEDKQPLFDLLDVLERSAAVLGTVVARASFDRERLSGATRSGFITATAMADALTELGVPFRTAHGLVGALVAEAERSGVELDSLTTDSIADVLRSADDPTARSFASDDARLRIILDAARLENALRRFDVIGGTAPARVAAALEAVAWLVSES